MYGSDWVSLDDLSLDLPFDLEHILQPENLTVRDVLEALRYERNKLKIGELPPDFKFEASTTAPRTNVHIAEIHTHPVTQAYLWGVACQVGVEDVFHDLFPQFRAMFVNMWEKFLDPRALKLSHRPGPALAEWVMDGLWAFVLADDPVDSLRAVQQHQGRGGDLCLINNFVASYSTWDKEKIRFDTLLLTLADFGDRSKPHYIFQLSYQEISGNATDVESFFQLMAGWCCRMVTRLYQISTLKPLCDELGIRMSTHDLASLKFDWTSGLSKNVILAEVPVPKIPARLKYWTRQQQPYKEKVTK